MRISFYILFIACWLSPKPELWAQNLIPNPGFEDYKGCGGDQEAAIADLVPWYVTAGTPDIIQLNCDPPVSFYIGIPTSYDAYEGDVFASFASVFFEYNMYYTEAMGVDLGQNLEAGQLYLFSFYAKSRSYDFPYPHTCPLPDHGLSVWASPDSIYIDYQRDIRFWIEDASINAKLLFKDTSAWVAPDPNYDPLAAREWQQYSYCFVADGTERHLAITHNFGRGRGARTPCVIDTTDDDALALYRMRFDNFSLTKLEKRRSLRTKACDLVGLEQLALEDIPETLRQDAVVTWPGQYQPADELDPGFYVVDINVRLPCDNIFFQINTEIVDCTPNPQIPTAFSPNGDGVNDQLQVFISEELDILEYEFMVFDRWGNAQFKSEDPNLLWEGRRANQPSDPGVYVYFLRVKTISASGKVEEASKAGEVTLMR